MSPWCAPWWPASPCSRLAAWVAALPAGRAPDVPYTLGATLHLPGDLRVSIAGTEFAILDVTPRGTMLLVEHYDPTFRTDYIWVSPDGVTTVVPGSRSRGVQDEAVSPDGRWFARGGEVADLTDGSVVAPIPGPATVLTGWVGGGVVYAAGRTTYLWEPGEKPHALEEWTWFPNRTDVGLVGRGRCRAVVHVYPSSGHTEEWGRQCGEPRALTVSPGGEWIVDRDLRLVDAAQEKTWALAGGPVTLATWAQTYWESRHEVLIALPTGVVRCDALERACERALDDPARLPVR